MNIILTNFADNQGIGISDLISMQLQSVAAIPFNSAKGMLAQELERMAKENGVESKIRDTENNKTWSDVAKTSKKKKDAYLAGIPHSELENISQ